MTSRRITSGVAAAVLIAASGQAALAADVAFDNMGGNGSFSSESGWSLGGPQSTFPAVHAFRFTSLASGGITRLVIPVEHDSGAANAFTFELCADGATAPGPSLGTLAQTSAEEFFYPEWPAVPVPCDGHISVTAGTSYWLVARGLGPASGDWRENSQFLVGPRAYQLLGGDWQYDPAVYVAAFRVEVNGPPVCYANCDGSTTSPALNVADFTCFLQYFYLGRPYANCDGSTAMPVLNVGDFTCFLQKFAQGCP
jgi:hypothetical protein